LNVKNKFIRTFTIIVFKNKAICSNMKVSYFAKYILVKGVGRGYVRQYYVHCLLKNMVICALENRTSSSSFLATQIVYIRYGQFHQKKDPFSFYLSMGVLLVFLYIIAADKSVLLLYACANKISLKYLFQEKIAIDICC